jgi:hypothetical protein
MGVIDVSEREIIINGKTVKIVRDNDIPEYCTDKNYRLEESNRTKRPYGQREVQV